MLSLCKERRGQRSRVRYMDMLGLSIQPSEFVKPCFAVVAAWMFAEQHGKRRLPGNAISILLYLMIVALLMAQPDFGMTFVISVTWFAQFVLAGLPLLWVGGLAVAGIGGVIGAYYMFPHVTTRIDGFLNPAGGDTYQVDRSLKISKIDDERLMEQLVLQLCAAT